MEKACGTCNLCCKLLEIHELEKPAGVWCRHAKPGQGCAIHGHHPPGCQAFRCFWLQEPQAAEAWKPDRCGFVIRELPGRILVVDVEPSRAQAWKREPFYGQIKRWSASATASSGAVLVRVAGRVTAVFPEAELDIGAGPGPQDRFMAGYEFRDGARRPVARVTRPDGAVTFFRA